MTGRDDDDFRLRPSPPRERPKTEPKFVSQVLKEVNKGGGAAARKAARRPGARLGRGHVAARFTGRGLPPNARRVIVKTRLVNLQKAGPRSTSTHLRYIQREGVGRDGEPGRAYGPETDDADLSTFEQRGRGDRHQFRFIVSAEEAEQLGDLRSYTRQLMARMETDLGTRLEWVAVDHWNTDNPHTHIVLRGKDDTGHDLIISRDYISHGMRERASELATRWLGPRSEREIQQSQRREVEQERWTGLDRTLQREADEGTIRLERLAEHPQRSPLVGRLQHLQRMGLAQETTTGAWRLREDAEPVLRAMGERGDIVRTMQHAMRELPRELAIRTPDEDAPPITGRVVAKGLMNELYERGYLVVDGTDGKAHYLPLPPKVELAQYPIGAVVATHGSNQRDVDKSIADLSVDGRFRTDHCLSVVAQYLDGEDPGWLVENHVRRLEALRPAGIVEREAEGVWRVPANLPELGRQYDLKRDGGVPVRLHSHLPVERQVRALGTTWLDKQLVAGDTHFGEHGFSGAVRTALQQRADFLVEQGFAERRGQRVTFARNLLATLRNRELEHAAKTIAADTGLSHRPVAKNERITGTYRRSVQLASGRFAVLEKGRGFSLVPWRPIIEQRIGQTLAATVRGDRVSWELGRDRGPSR
ncbi:DUF3363 domain-containing protein [Luteimonas marina]|uniref:DUF3363 domain-containing protein n=1 Tax=Luteimonas marina TaxID=488485 RepID=A0A5C5U4N5_9GAMM|nr:relaxase/mobilization nuclease and DUF3363 domain-containing protein [Luteimonas marina]TWT20310.1 DUF3363 domain-containing protein [Luteimonas marina]